MSYQRKLAVLCNYNIIRADKATTYYIHYLCGRVVQAPLDAPADLAVSADLATEAALAGPADLATEADLADVAEPQVVPHLADDAVLAAEADLAEVALVDTMVKISYNNLI